MKVPPPDSCYAFGIQSNLVVLKGSLSLIYYASMGERRFEIWVMTELGVEESWTKLCIVGPFSGTVEPVGSWKDGQILFKDTESQSNMLSYDPCSQETRYFSVPGAKILGGVFDYVESLEVVDRCTSGKGGFKEKICGKIQYINLFGVAIGQNENSLDLENCDNDFVRKFAIPGPKGSHILHCRLCGERFYNGICVLKLHLAHQGHRGSPYVFLQSGFISHCPYASDYIKEQVKLYLPLSNKHISKKATVAPSKK